MEVITLTRLAQRAEVTPRTIRYYIQIGLLPAPGTAGPGAHYDESYVDRIRQIKRLQRAHLPLAEIRKRLETPLEMRIAFAAPPRPAPGEPSHAVRDERMDLAVPPPPPSRSQWERIALSPDIELHVQRPLTRDMNRIVEEIVKHAQHLLKDQWG
ncbi:MAG: MerR family transcriptional regulator [Gemmatimonadota bacterium]